MDPQFDEHDDGARPAPEPEPEREPVAEAGLEPESEPAPEPDQVPEPASESGSGFAPVAGPTTEPEPGAQPVPAFGWRPSPDPAAGLEAETVLLDGEAEPEDRGSVPHRVRMAFRTWRRSRPFWGALLVTLGGLEILYSEKAPLRVVVHFGPLGIAGYLLPLIMVLCGLLMWFNPAQRTFYSILSVLLSLGTWITSNLGGFIIGLLLGVIGGSLAFGWRPFSEEEFEEREDRRSRKKALRAKRRAARSGRAGAGGTRTAQSGRAARTARPRRVEPAGGGDPEIGKPTEA